MDTIFLFSWFMRRENRLLGLVMGFLFWSCALHPPLPSIPDPEVGHASWYGNKFQGRSTASGETYDMNQLTAAHPRAAFGTRIRVINLATQKEVVVRVNDRGPFVKGRVIDLSFEAARRLGLVESGTAKVRLEFLDQTPVPNTFLVQAGSFREAENARQMQEALVRDFPEQRPTIEINNGLHRVFLGPLPEESQAVGWVERLRRSGYSAFILHR